MKARKIKQNVRGMKKIADSKAYFPILQIYNSKRFVQSFFGELTKTLV
jgi:hypothetical protein